MPSPNSTGEEVASTTDFVLHVGTERDGLWRTPQPLQLPEMGYYRIAVEAADAEGQTGSHEYVGDFLYLVDTWIDGFAVSPTTVTYANPKVAVTGKLMGRWPADRAVRPLGDFPMRASGNFGDPVQFHTAGDGTFRGEVTIVHQDELVGVATDSQEIQYRPAYANADTRIDPMPLRIPVQVSDRRIIAGEQIQITGQVKWRSPSGWAGYPGQYVGVLYCYDEQCNRSQSIDYPELDDQGRFSVSYTPRENGWVRVGYGADDPWTQVTIAEMKFVDVTWRAEFTTFSAVRENPGQVRVSGHLAFRSGFTPGTMPIEIQFSRTGTGNWRTLKTVDIGSNPTNPEGYSFSELADQSRSGFWRVVYHGGEYFQTDRTDPIQVA